MFENPLPNLSPGEWLLAVAITLVAAFVQGRLGLGFAVVSVPPLTLLAPALAPVPQLLLAAPLTVGSAFREWRSADLRSVKAVLAGRVPGGLAGLVLIQTLPGPALELLLGLIILAAAVALWRRPNIRRTPFREAVAGFLSGIGSMVASTGGPPLGIVYAQDPAPTIRATLGLHFSLGIAISVCLRLIGHKLSWTDAHVALWLLPGMLVGFGLSTWANQRAPTPALRRPVLILCAIAAGLVCLRALL